MIEDLHRLATLQVEHSPEPADNQTLFTKRNLCLNKTFDIEKIYEDENEYTYNNGLRLENNDVHKAKNMRFLVQEWDDWKKGIPLGESNSQYCYPELWEGKFDDYCYSDRLGMNLYRQAQQIQNNPESRQNFIAIWSKADEGNKIVPCTIGYNVQIIDDTAYFTFIYRSVEVRYNFVNDLWLNKEYIKFILKETGYDREVKKVNVAYFINNAHIYPKDWDERYKGLK